jgi:CTP:molybdopterin cytidylyltransferase MocA
VSGCAGLVLAAGEGRRLGRPKALVEVGGELLVERAVQVLREGGCEPVAVVLGAAAFDVVARARLDDVLVVVNDGWAEGIGSSLRTGLAAMQGLRAERVVVALADQPGVTPDVVRRLVASPSSAAAVVASYGGRPGNPARLDAAVWDDVCALAVGDVGARAWMRAHPESVEVIACDDLGNDDDIDTADDLARLGQRMEPKA